MEKVSEIIEDEETDHYWVHYVGNYDQGYKMRTKISKQRICEENIDGVTDAPLGNIRNC